MNKYETVFLVKNNISEEKRTEIVDKIKTFIKDNGKVTKVEFIGKRKLAYEIQKQKEAYYYIIYFETEPSNILELERIYRITDEILKFIVVKQEI